MNPDDVAIDFEVKNPHWLHDEWGDYWTGEVWKNGKRVALTGTYYSLNEQGTVRISRKEQEQQMTMRFA